MHRIIDTIRGDKDHNFLGEIKRSEVSIVADNVYRHYYLDMDETIPPQIFNVAPPWEAFWIEGRVPREYREELRRECPGEVLQEYVYGIGVLFEQVFVGDSLPAIAGYTKDEIFEKLRSFGREQNKEEYVDGLVEMMREDPSWIMRCWVFLQAGDGAVSPPMLFTFPVQKDGTVQNNTVILTSQQSWNAKPDESVFNMLNPALITLTFFHCKNTEPVEVVPSKGRQKKRRRQGKAPLTTYKVLQVHPTNQKKKSRKAVVDSSGDLIPQRLHIRRGHFKTYTPDKPLFGKLVGTWWWNSEVRGDPDTGLSLHDYEVFSK